LLDSDHQAGTIMHEIVYREALELGHEDSAKARVLNVMLASGEVESMYQDEYQEWMISLNLPPVVEYDGVQFYIGTVEYFEGTKKVARGRLFSDWNIWEGLTLAGGGYISFYENCAFKEGVLAKEFRDYEMCLLVSAGRTVTFSVDKKLIMVDGRDVQTLIESLGYYYAYYDYYPGEDYDVIRYPVD